MKPRGDFIDHAWNHPDKQRCNECQWKLVDVKQCIGRTQMKPREWTNVSGRSTRADFGVGWC